MFISHSDAAIMLQIVGGKAVFQEHFEIELLCIISPYNNEMTWLVDNDPYASCFLGFCSPVANKPYSFIFKFDESAGNFTLKISSVNSSHAGMLFACDDGNERKNINFIVTRDT